MPEAVPISYFFDAGLHFTCQQCRVCCTGTPGIVRVATAEIEAIAAFLKMTPQRLTEDYLVDLNGVSSIAEHADGRCRFYADGCRIYPVRPRQCRTYPFWLSILRSERNWRREGRQCAGIGQGRIYSREEILDLVARDMDGRTAGGAAVNNGRPVVSSRQGISQPPG